MENLFLSFTAMNLPKMVCLRRLSLLPYCPILVDSGVCLACLCSSVNLPMTVSTVDGFFYCLSRADGSALWRQKLDSPVSAVFLADSNNLLFRLAHRYIEQIQTPSSSSSPPSESTSSPNSSADVHQKQSADLMNPDRGQGLLSALVALYYLSIFISRCFDLCLS